MFKRLLKYAKLNPTERKDFSILFSQSLLSGFGAAFFFVVANTYFIQKTKVSSLPPGYIMSGIFGYILIAGYKKWQHRFGIISAYTAGYILYGAAGVLLFFGRLIFPESSFASTIIAYIGFIVVLPFAAMQVLGFSTICLRVFNISQSKRLLALIGTGEVIASIIAYLMIPFLHKWLGNAPLLLFSAAANILATIPLRNIYHNNKAKLSSARNVASQVKMNLAYFRKDRFFMMIAVITVFSVSAVYFADYAYLLSVRYISHASGIEIATVVAVIFSVIKIGELLFSLYSARIIRNYGMNISLVILPVLLVVSSLVGSLSGVIFTGIPFFVVCFLLFNKWAERVVRKGVTIPAMKVMYQVTEPEDRARLQATIDGTINQYATIGAGVVLLGLSFVINSDDILFFLRTISFVYLIIFAVWAWLSFLLFSMYKVRIKEYLNTLASRKSLGVDKARDGAINAGKVKDEVYDSILSRAVSFARTINKGDTNEYLLYYNPSLKNVYAGQATLAQVKRAYYGNDNFFSRVIIIWYMGRQSGAERLKFVKEYYSISELQLRVQMLTMVSADGFKIPQEDVFFFTGLCQDNAAEIMWAYASKNDLQGTVHANLIDALNDHILLLQNLMFGLMKILYERQYIESVQEIFMSKDRSDENLMFAVELLDSMLESQMKKMILPLFEDISFGSRKEKLQKILLVYQLTPELRLKEILMTSFMTVSPHLKQLALKEYYKLTSDISILKAHAASSSESLQSAARILLGSTDDYAFISKMKVVEKMKLSHDIHPHLLVHFVNWGLFSTSRKKNIGGNSEFVRKHTFQFNDQFVAPIVENGTKLSVDTFGLSLLLKINDHAN